jgi:hypothetical protein
MTGCCGRSVGGGSSLSLFLLAANACKTYPGLRSVLPTFQKRYALCLGLVPPSKSAQKNHQRSSVRIPKAVNLRTGHRDP